MPTRFTLHPLFNPDTCPDYPPSIIKDKPECELSFLLECSQDDETDRHPVVDDAKRSAVANGESKHNLACSLILRGIKSCFDDPMSSQELTQCLTSSNFVDRAKPVIIVCHGSCSWRNQMLISNLASKLSIALNVHTLRFDFTGNGHSSGEWKYSNVAQDYKDLCKIVEFVQVGLGCEVACVIGHSLASASVIQYAATNANMEESGRKIACKYYVNLAGHFYCPNQQSIPFADDDMTELTEKGFFYLKHPLEGRRLTKFKVTKEQVELRANRDSYDAVKHLGRKDSQIRILTIHGSKDKMVHVDNAYKFDREIANHTLHIIEGACHNFNGLKFHDLIVSTISSLMNLKM